MKTKISVSRQALVDNNIDWQEFRLVNLEDPVDDMDAVNLRSLQDYVDNAVGSGSGSIAIGNAEDGTYTDGLFTDFVPTTLVGTAVDRFNEVLKSLSPQPAPVFSSASCADTGVSGKLSFGASNAIAGYTDVPAIDVNGQYVASGNRRGIFNASTTINGTLADNNTANNTNGRPFPNYSFGDGDQGTLHLEVNGSVVHSVDLTTFGSGSSLNGNGSGFSLSAATSVQFDNGDPFAVFKYRTGTWQINPADQRNGYNTARVRHEYSSGLYRDSQTYDWVVDDDTTATSFASELLSALSMSGSRFLSGVEYHTGGTASYAITINNAYRNTFSRSSTGLNFTGTNVSVTDSAIPDTSTEADQISVSGKTVTVNATRLINGSLTTSVSVDRTVQSDLQSSGSSISGILLDSTADNSSATILRFNGEARRIHSGVSLSAVNYGSGAAGSQQAVWDSTQSLVGADINHNSGLLVHNGKLMYPDIDFSTLAANGPSGNVDYSSAAGNRTFIGFFYDALAHSNFRLNVVGSSIAFVPVASGPSGNNLTLEILAPNTTVDGSSAVEWKDAVVPHSGIDTDIGCYASTYGNSIPTNWGCTIGTKNTSTSGYVILVRVTASAAWTGDLTSIGITWL